jgi:hypothetical protein
VKRKSVTVRWGLKEAWRRAGINRRGVANEYPRSARTKTEVSRWRRARGEDGRRALGCGVWASTRYKQGAECRISLLIVENTHPNCIFVPYSLLA